MIESYPDDRRLPCYLVWASEEDEVFHIVFAVDYTNENVRAVTAYRPDPELWDDDLKQRRKP